VLQEAQRRLKETVERKANSNDLNDIDLRNILLNAERLAIERLQQMQSLEHDKEVLQEQIRERQETLFKLQN